MLKRFFFPLRFKILFFLLAGITVMMSIITFTMANIFHEDKSSYIHAVIMTGAVNIANETDYLIQSYVERTRSFARVAYDQKISEEEKTVMLKDLFLDFPEIVSISFHAEGSRPATVFDDQFLRTHGLSKADIDTYRDEHPLPDGGIASDEILIRNFTFVEDLPLLMVGTTFTTTEDSKPIVVEALIRMERLINLLGRSDMFESFLLDNERGLIAHENPERIFSRSPIEGIPEAAWQTQPTFEGPIVEQTLEFISGGVEMIGGFAKVETGGLLAVVQKPKAAAFLSAEDLFANLYLVSLIILVSVTIIGLAWSYRMTRPLERLSRATQEVAKGDFEIQVKQTSRDEIGKLSLSFNRMASELRDRENKLQETQAALVQSEKMSAFGQLSAGIAHEVKNPLAGILGYAQLCMKKLDDDSPIIKNLKTIEKETNRCNSIIEKLMKFARQEQTEFEHTQINQVVEDAVSIVAHQLGVSHIKIEKELAEDLPFIHGNSNQLQQVLLNILINAQQAMDGNPGTVKIVTRLTDTDSLEIRISDTGPGLPIEIQDRIFEPFFTTKPAGKGTGLGLSVTYGIIKDHGGNIHVDSKPGEGATFIIGLPVTSKDLTEDKTAEVS